MERNEYIKTKSDKVNTYVEFSGRQTGKTDRLLNRAILESYQNNVVIFCNLRGKQRLFEKLPWTLPNIPSNQNTTESDAFIPNRMIRNLQSNKKIYLISEFGDYINTCYRGTNNKHSFFFEEAAFNSNIGFLSHKEILENIAPNGLLYFSTTLKNFLQKKSPLLTDFQDDPMQFLYEEFGIDVNLKTKIPMNTYAYNADQQKLEEGYLFKTVGQTTYE